MRMALERLVESPSFIGFTQALIVINAVALGIEAMPAVGEPYEAALGWLFSASTAWFVVEIGLRFAATGGHVRRFFANGWNSFDFAIVMLSLIPLAGGVAIVARLLRLLRLLRLVSGLSLLRGFVAGTLTWTAHLGAGLLLLALSIYMFALAGFHLAGGVLAELPQWSTLGPAITSVMAWLLPFAPPPLPAEGLQGQTFLVMLALAHIAWLALLARGFFARKTP